MSRAAWRRLRHGFVTTHAWQQHAGKHERPHSASRTVTDSTRTTGWHTVVGESSDDLAPEGGVKPARATDTAAPCQALEAGCTAGGAPSTQSHAANEAQAASSMDGSRNPSPRSASDESRTTALPFGAAAGANAGATTDAGADADADADADASADTVSGADADAGAGADADVSAGTVTGAGAGAGAGDKSKLSTAPRSSQLEPSAAPVQDSEGGLAPVPEAKAADAFVTDTISAHAQHAPPSALLPVQKRGYLTKRGRVRKNWLRRYFLLTASRLAYFSKRLGVLKGQLELVPSSRCHRIDRPLSFRVTGADHREMLIQGDTEADVASWIYAIRTNIAALQMLAAAAPESQAGPEILASPGRKRKW